MSIDPLDFNKICRICLSNTNTLQLISIKIVEMIQQCAAVQISYNDELPSHICDICLNRLQDSFDFKELCEKSDSNLRHIINEHKIINKNENLFSDDNASLKSEKIDSDDSNCKYPTEFEYKIEVNDNDSIRNSKNSNVNHELTFLKSDGDSDCLKDEVVDFSNNSNVKLTTKRNKVSIDKRGLNVKTQQKEKPYNCEKCNEKFEKTWSLAFHMKRVHKAKGLKCDKCPKICFHTLHLLDHQKIHNGTDFICEICKKHFANQHKLGRHKSSHLTERTFYCFQCNNSFKDKWVLRKHIKTIHLNAEKRITCDICNKKMLPRHLERHRLIHQQRQTISCEKCSKQFYHASSLKMHIQREHENVGRKFKRLCNICGRSVGSEAELKRHLLTHTGEKPYACDKCDKKYRTTSMLKTHISRSHLNERNYICSVCSRGFFDRVLLANHVRTHTGERPFSCSTCNKNYKTKSMLTTHISRTHLNKFDHACSICSRRFHDRRNLINHVQTHSEQKPFICDICEKKYSSKAALSHHMKIHVIKN